MKNERTSSGRRVLLTAIVIGLTFVSVSPDAVAQRNLDIPEDRTKVGQSGLQFLVVPLHARASAMAGAVTAREIGSDALFYNPAGMGRLQQSIHVGFGQSRWIGDIRYDYGSIALAPAGGTYGVFGVSLVSVNYGDLNETIRATNASGYRQIGTYSPSAFAAGVGYAQSLTDRFSVGGQVKYVRQALGSSVMGFADNGGGMRRSDLEVSTPAVDFGVFYETGFRSLVFAASFRNFSGEVTYASQNFELPLHFRIGASMDMVDFTQLDPEIHAFNLSIDASHPRSNVEQVRVGGEYTFMEIVSLRAGYAVPSEEQGINVGAGVQQSVGSFGLALDYGYTEFGLFGNVHRVGLHLAF